MRLQQQLIGFVFGTIGAASVAALIAAAAKPVPITSPVPGGDVGPVGRYQVVHLGAYANADTCWVIDTMNGHLWHYNTADKAYRDEGMPPVGTK